MEDVNTITIESSQQHPEIPASAVGLIWSTDGTLFPFGIFPPSVEAQVAPTPEIWKEIKICPPSQMLVPSGNAPITCLANFCIGKIRSREEHVMKHLTMIMEEQVKINRLKETYDLPPTLKMQYYCDQSICYTGLTMLDESRAFNKLKYLKQHYLKVHAPRTYSCAMCKKSFSTLGLLGSHMKNCGNSFECDTCHKIYQTLEALQTHCKRNDHSFDYGKYKDSIETVKNEISALRQKESNKDLKVKKKRTKELKNTDKNHDALSIRPLTTTSLTCYQWIPSNVENLNMKNEVSTQTDPELSSSKAKKSSSQRQGGRKRSAETQTTKIKYKVSTEAQTLNVTKRRRTSKKHIAEAETQCSVTKSVTPTSTSIDKKEQTDPSSQPASPEMVDSFDLDQEFSNIMKFVTTETQTSFANSETGTSLESFCSYPVIDLLSEWSDIIQFPSVSYSQTDLSLPFNENYPVSPTIEESRNSPSYMETIDGETQTLFLDEFYNDPLFDLFDSPMMDPTI